MVKIGYGDAYVEVQPADLAWLCASPLRMMVRRMRSDREQVGTDADERFLFSCIVEGSEEDLHHFVNDLQKIPGVYQAKSTSFIKLGGEYRTRVRTISDRDDLQADVLQFGLRRGVVVTIDNPPA